MMPTHVTVRATGLLFVVSFLSAPQFANAAAQAVTAREADELVRYHNKVRDEVGVGPVKWSPALARFAQEWADEVARTGKIGHRPGEGEFAQKYGENIAWGSGGGYDVLTAARSWYEEKESYTPGTPIPRDFRDFKAGHYTQMVWKDTTEIGAGKAVIQAGDQKGSLFVVCNYNPRGNMIGEKPFPATGIARGGDAQGGGETASAKLGSTSLRVLEPVDVEGPFPRTGSRGRGGGCGPAPGRLSGPPPLPLRGFGEGLRPRAHRPLRDEQRRSGRGAGAGAETGRDRQRLLQCFRARQQPG